MSFPPERGLLAAGAEQCRRWAARDRAVVLWMHRAAARAWVVRGLAPFSHLGDGWMWGLLIVALPWISEATGTRCATRMVAVGTLNLLIYFIVKHFVARPRPYRACPGVRPCVPSLDEFSFPSGHTLHSVAFSVILAAYYPDWAYVVWPFTALVALSRVVLGVHYLSDVIVGAIIGAITAGVSFNLL